MVLSIMNRYYFAKNNDTAAIISRRLGVDCNAILRLNQCVHAGLSKHAKLNRGCHLFIPGSDETMLLLVTATALRWAVAEVTAKCLHFQKMMADGVRMAVAWHAMAAEAEQQQHETGK